MTIGKRFGYGWSLLGKSLRLVANNPSLLAFSLVVTLVMLITSRLTTTFFPPQDMIIGLKPMTLLIIERGMSSSVMQTWLGYTLFLLACIIFHMYVQVVYNGMVGDALARKPRQVGRRLHEALLRIFSPSWLLLFVLAYLIAPGIAILIFAYPLLSEGPLGIAELFSQSIKLFFSSIPELCGAWLALFLAFLVLLVGGSFPLGITITYFSTAAPVPIGGMAIGVAAAISIFVAVAFVFLMAGLAALPMLIYKKAK